MNRIDFWKFGRYAIATLLLASAILKLHLLLSDPFADLKTGVSIWFLPLIIGWELSVSILVFRHVDDRRSWIALLGMMALFLVVSASRWANGLASCGRFGHLETPSWLSTFISGSAVLILLAKCPTNHIAQDMTSFSEFKNASTKGRSWTGTFGIVLGILVFSISLLIFQSQLHPTENSSIIAGVSLDDDLAVGESQTVRVELTTAY